LVNHTKQDWRAFFDLMNLSFAYPALKTKVREVDSRTNNSELFWRYLEIYVERIYALYNI